MSSMFIFNVTQCSREIKVSIDSSFCNDRTRFFNSVDFNLAIWFMINTHFFWLAIDTENTSGVSCIRNIYLLFFLINIYDISGTTYWIQHHFFISLLAWIFLFTCFSKQIKKCRFIWWLLPPKITKCILTFLRPDFIINFKEWLSHPLFFIFFFYCLKSTVEDLLIIHVTKLCDFSSTMAIKDTK